MFRAAFLAVFLLILWLQSLFTQTTHVIEGNTHIFKYNWVPWLFLGIMTLTLVGFAEIARRVLKERFIAVICLLGIPLFAFLSLEYVCERVKVTEHMLVHRREPPHTEYNLDIPWESIQAATKIRREQPGFFAPNFFNVGYEFRLTDGTTQELPSNIVLTSAQHVIDNELEDRKIPIKIRNVPIPKQ